MKQNKTIRTLLSLCTALVILTLAVVAATPREMYENGVVSDGGVSFGDVRDGIVSDVSDGVGNENNMLRNGMGNGGRNGMGDGAGNGNATGSGQNGIGNFAPGEDFGGNTGGISGRDISKIDASSDSSGNNGSSDSANGNGSNANGNGDSAGSAIWGVLIAIAVVIAVIVIIFMATAKRNK